MLARGCRPPLLLKTLSKNVRPAPFGATKRLQLKSTLTQLNVWKQQQGAFHSKEAGQLYEKKETVAADHLGRQQNHIWSREEIDFHLQNLTKHEPVTVSDRIMKLAMDVLYHGFNFVTGYKPQNSSVKSIEWRLIVLESFAGVPGFVAAGFRHFRSLRQLQRDHGWIATLLEEAENERMHLLVCLKMFNASLLTRGMVIGAQLSMTPLLMGVYLLHPPAAHRFVGYLEETACHTYANVIRQVETPGTELHEKWHELPAPDIAKSYWRLPEDAMFIDTLKCMFADEAHHRDVNHTFAELPSDAPSPFALSHKEDTLLAVEMEKRGLKAWPSAAELEQRAAASDGKPTAEDAAKK